MFISFPALYGAVDMLLNINKIVTIEDHGRIRTIRLGSNWDEAFYTEETLQELKTKIEDAIKGYKEDVTSLQTLPYYPPYYS